MRINQNIAAFNAYRNLNQTQSSLASSLEKLSSGFRINRAADDASGLVNSENLRSQIGGLKVATRNAQDAISMVQTAEGAQTEVHSILQRMRDLAVQSGNLGTNDTEALKANQSELNKLVEELDRIADETQFGTQQILNGDFAVTPAAAAITGIDAVNAELEFTHTSGTSAAAVVYDLTVGGNTVQVTVDADATAGTVASAINALTGFSATETANVITVTGDANDGDEISIAVNVTASTADTGIASVGSFTVTTGVSAVTAQSATAASGGAVFQVGANQGQTVRVGINGVGASALAVNALDIGRLDASGNLTTSAGTIESAIGAIDEAIGTVSENRAELGAFQNRMESTIRNLSVAVENLSAAESRIRDTDMALEMVEFTRNQILSQAGTAMLAQANVIPQSVLSLLG